MAGSVLVIGAGMAGLFAATKLVAAGFQVTVLEANDRVGGRLCTVYAEGGPIELGAEFIHGKPPELLALVRELGLSTTEHEGEMVTYGADGSLHPESEESDRQEGGPFSVLERLRLWSDAHPAEDMSFMEWVATQGFDGPELAGAKAFVEGFNAADAEEISVRSLAIQQAAEDETGGTDGAHLQGGYSLLAESLANRLRKDGGDLRLREHVVAVEWQKGRVTAVLADGDQVSADCALITLSLGVLQARSVRFSPEPGMVLHHASRMSMGQVCRLTLVFRRRWWAELDGPHQEALSRLSFLLPAERTESDDRARFQVFWTGPSPDSAILTAWSGGPAAQRFASLDEHALAHIACADLARIFGLEKSAVLNELVSHHHHDWTRDPLFCGAYSWVPVGGASASAAMCEPVEDTLFFAGEHTDTTGNWGTVHGALRSGLRAAEQILARSQKSSIPRL